MKLRVLSVGHRPPAWAAAAFEDYARRMPRELAIEPIALKPARRDGDAVALAARARAEEGQRIVAAIPTGSVKVALDERGFAWTTQQFARALEAWMGAGRDVCFIIGGADGLDDEVRRGADVLLSLSAMTMPHALARVVLAEQLYRAVSLIRNHPYHRQ